MYLCSGTRDWTHDEIVHGENECPLCKVLESAEISLKEIGKARADLLRNMREKLDLNRSRVMGDGDLAPELMEYIPVISSNITNSWIKELEDIDLDITLDT